MSIQSILCVNTFSQTHAEETATREHYVGSDMTNSLCLLPMWRMLHQVWQHQYPPCGTQMVTIMQQHKHQQQQQQQQHQEQMRMMMTQMINMNM